MYQLLVAGIREALLDTENHVCPSWPYMYQLLVAGIREALLDTEDHVCPSCKESSISPDGLISNKFLRTAVNNFLNETGYTKARCHSSGMELPPPPPTQSTHRPALEATDIQQIAISVSSSDVMDPWQESPLPYDDLLGLPPQVVKPRQAGLSSLQPGASTPPQHNSHR